MHLAMLAMPFLCCSSLVVCSTFLAISSSSLSSEPSPRYSPEQMVLANSTAPQCSFGSSLKMFGSLDFGLGTEGVLGTLGIGGGMTGMFMPLMPGMVAGQLAGTTLLKSQGMLLGAGSLGGGLSFLPFLSFLIFFCFLSFLGLERELSELSSESLSSEPELYFSFFFFLSSLSFFLSFFLSFSLCFFLSPINYYNEGIALFHIHYHFCEKKTRLLPAFDAPSRLSSSAFISLNGSSRSNLSLFSRSISITSLNFLGSISCALFSLPRLPSYCKMRCLLESTLWWLDRRFSMFSFWKQDFLKLLCALMRAALSMLSSMAELARFLKKSLRYSTVSCRDSRCLDFRSSCTSLIRMAIDDFLVILSKELRLMVLVPLLLHKDSQCSASRSSGKWMVGTLKVILSYRGNI